MWMEIIKALPRKEDIENYLLNDEGVQAIEGMAKLPDKTGIRGAIDRTKELSEGTNISSANSDKRKTIIENAKKLHKILTEILRESKTNVQPAKMKGKLSKILNDILEQEDMEAFKKFVGTAPLRTTKNADEKKKALKARQSDIESFIAGNEDEFYWINTSDRTINTTDSPPEYVKGNRGRIDHDTLGSIFSTKLPDKMLLEDYKNLMEWFAAGKKTKPIGYTTKGRVEMSPLVQVFGLLSKRATKEALNPFKDKKIEVTINSGADVLKYLNLLTKPRWRRAKEFMPTPTLDSSNAITNARNELLMPQGKVIIPEALKSVLGSEQLNIGSLLEEGTQQTQIKLIPNQVRMILTEQVPFDYEEEGITLDTLDSLKEHYNTVKEIPKFYAKINRIGGREKEALNKIIESYSKKQNMFDEEEAERLDALKEKELEIGSLREALEEMYNTKPSISFANDLDDLMVAVGEDSLFTKVGDLYKLNADSIASEERDAFINEFTQLRTKDDFTKVKIEKDSWSKIEEEYDEDYDLSTASSKSTDIFHVIATLDFYYSESELYEKIQDWKNPDEYEEEDVLFDEVQQYAIDNYSNILNGFIEATKNKVEDIINSPEKYQDKLVYEEYERDAEGKKTGKTKSKAGALISELEKAEVVRVQG